MPVIDIIRFMTAGCLLLISLQVGQSRIATMQKIPVVAFTLCVLGYLLADWEPLRDHSLFYVFLTLAVALPFAFWLLSKCLFDDRFRLQIWMGLALVGFLVIQCSFFFYTSVYQRESDTNGIQNFVSLLQYTLPLLFVVLAITVAASGKEADLISPRIQFRTYFILLSAALIFITLLSELAFQGSKVPDKLELLQKLSIAGLSFYFAGRRLTFMKGFFIPVKEPDPITEEKPESDPALLANLASLMEEQEIWRTEGLTISMLSAKMGCKEYKLRNAINQHLGYRNFNDFLHSYRIKEACLLLSDPKFRDMTVLEIAFKIGYNSLAPFNKAFKQTTRMTPTAWRRSKTQ